MTEEPKTPQEPEAAGSACSAGVGRLDIFEMKTHCAKHNFMSQDDECQFCVTEQRDHYRQLLEEVAGQDRMCLCGRCLPCRAYAAIN